MLGREQPSSFNPPYQIHTNGDGTGDIEFDFWSARKTCYYHTFNNLDGSEACVVEESSSSSPKKVTDASPLLSNSYSRRQAIEEGRKELMEMICKMPESCYELSLKDLVDHEQHKVKAVPEEKGFRFETETQTKKKRKACPISTTASMEANSFLIKMIFPTSLSFKKKSTAENTSKVSPSPPCEGSNKQRWVWIKRIFNPRNDNNRQDSTANNNNNNSSRSRADNRSSLPGCWLFFDFKKSKVKRQGDYII
ncbi:hypothetical protein PTKIN_Ptkin07bG0095700 [Pterospermum kingtungense]